MWILMASQEKRICRGGLAVVALLLVVNLATPQARSDIILNQAAQYGLLFEGGGNNTLQITNVTVNGNIGVGGTGKMTVSGPGTINGRIDFSAPNTGQFSNNNGSTVYNPPLSATNPSYNNGTVTSALNWVNGLNTSFGAKAGTNINISGTTTINVSAGMSDGLGNRIFNVTGFNTTNNDVITIVGDLAHDNVIFNFTGSANFNNQVTLNGIDSDSVLWNFVGGSNLSGGPTLQINTNFSSHPTQSAQGIFLDPNGAISVVNANLMGRVFGGDSHDFQYVSGANLRSPSMVPEPATFTLALLSAPFLGFMAWRRRLPCSGR
jgi:hypothetical protein